MSVTIKMTGELYAAVRTDLGRPHPFAAERVGFVLGRLAQRANGHLIVLTRYQPIPDVHYLEDETVGACIGPLAMTAAMQAVYQGRSCREGIFHIHVHEHEGETGMSHTDRDGIPPMLPGLRRAGREAPHGIIILSADHGAAWVSLPGNADLLSVTEMSVVGTPIQVFRKGAGR